MTLYSPIFLFVFLPLAAAGYHVLPKPLRAAVLSVLSLAFYIFAAGKYFFILPILSLAAYGLSFLGKKGFYICLALFVPLRLLGITAVGVSFFILRAAAYIYDGRCERNFFKVFAFLMFFPAVHAGPLARYGGFEHGFYSDTDYTQMSRGICLALYGAFKKLFFADALYAAFGMFLSGDTSLSAALALFSYAMYIYFDFSGCSDMAQGIAAIFGFTLPKNFDFPYMSRSVGEFFRRWHMSLGRWLFDYVYVPLGGSKNGRARTVVSLLAVWLVSALWHGTTLSYLLWGVYFFVICTAEKLILPQKFKIGRLCTFTLVLFGWVLFFSKTPPKALSFFTRLLCFGDTLLYSRADIYNGMRYAPFLLLAALFASPLPRKMLAESYLRARPLVYLASLPLVLLILSCIIAGGHIPFLYATF